MLSRFNKIVLSFLAVNSPAFAFDAVVMDDESLFTALDKTVPVITSTYIGWGEGWRWAGTNISSDHRRDVPYKGSSFSGKVDGLGINFTGEMDVSSDKDITWTYNWDKQQNFPNATGYGIEFNIKLESSSFSGRAKDPVLLADNRGWRWVTPNGQLVEVTFSPSVAKVFFDKGNKEKIRVLFFRDVSKGTGQTTMSVTMSDSVKMMGPSKLDYGNSDESLWHKNVLPADTSPIDLSFLNKGDIPAGQHGFIVADKDQLVFEDNTPAKFWGTNVQAYALFSSTDAEIQKHAKRIAKLGFNLVRIHHHDSSWVEPNVFKNPDTDTLELSEEALKKIDWWVKCLKDEGVYLWVDLHVGRRFMKDDGVEGFSDFSHGLNHAEVRGFNYYNDDVKELMKAFNKAYLTHVNSFTGLAYKDDPAVIAYLITNENDLSQHFGNSLLPDKNVPIHNAIFSKDVKAFSRKFQLSEQKTGQTWKMGESKIYLNDVEHRFNQDMIDQLDELGVKSLIATTNSWGEMGMFGTPSLTDGSIIDAHSYGKANEFKFNPRYSPGYLTWIGAAQVASKPLSVTEWNIEPFPVKDRFTAPIYMASIANLQGWDALMNYGYSQNSNWDTMAGSNYSTFNDPAVTGLMPAAALLYRQNHVAQANNTYELNLDRKEFFFTRHDPRSSKAIRTVLETSRFTVAMPDTPELPWLADNNRSEENAIVFSDVNRDFIPEGQDFVESDTGELKRDWSKGIHTINTKKSQVVSGWVGGESIVLDDVKFNIETKNVVLAVQSLENTPISESSRLFITAMARSKLESGDALPFISEPVVGTIEIDGVEGLRLYPINNLGKLDDKISIERNREGKYVIELTADMKYHWFVLQDTVPAFDITFPADASEYTEEEIIPLKTNATELEKEVSKVEYFHDDWELISTTSHSPYGYDLKISEKGRYTVRSRVTFKDGSKASTKILLSIKEAPYQIMSPQEGDEVTADKSFTIKTNASKWADKVKEVSFWKDGWKYLHSDDSSPYEYTISGLSLGEHILRTRMTFLDGTSRASTITINAVELAADHPSTVVVRNEPDVVIKKNDQPVEKEPKNADSGEPKKLGNDFTISYPVDGGTYSKGESITFQTNASQWDGDVRLVEYWAGNWDYLHGSNTSPYEFSKSDLSLGSHLIRSRLTHSDGTQRNTEITIHIVKPEATVNPFSPADGSKVGPASKSSFRIVSPVDGAVFSSKEEVVLKTQSPEHDANIDSVYYWYDDWKWLGRSIVPPFEHRVSDMPAGDHIIYSRVIYRDGRTELTHINVNIEPTAFNMSPTSGSEFKVGERVDLKTNFLELGGNVMSVHFWKDSWKYLGGFYAEPYEMTVTDLAVGEHILRARVIFDDATVLDTNAKVTVR